MRIFSYLTVLVFLIASCQEPSNEQLKELQVQFGKDTGGQIDTKVGLHWIENFERANDGQAPVPAFNVSLSSLKKIKSLNNIMGITLHYAIDEAGTQHILLTPIDEQLRVWSGVVVDANTDSEISVQTAQAWTANFKSANDGSILRHSFGINIFSEVEQYQSFQIVPAIDDSQRKVLLLILRPASNGRTMDPPPVILDQSKPCPPYC